MKKKAHEEHENSERWLLTYADLITLLLGLFVVLYSTAQQDTEKFRRAMRAMARTLNPVEDAKGGNSKEFNIIIGGGKDAIDGKEKKEQKQDNRCLDKNLNELKEKIEKDEKFGKGLSVRLSEEGLIIDLEEHLLFDTGKTDFKKDAIKILDRFADYIKEIKNKVKIIGHTDNVPIHNSLFPSNWHLSLARASKTAEYFIFKKNIDLKRFVVSAYADTQPIADNKTEEGRQKNRRVEIIVLKEEDKTNLELLEKKELK